MDIDAIRDVLLKSMDESLAANIEANETANRLGQQKLMYSNEARGTLYSGQPTWERAQLAAEGLQNLAKIQESDLNQRVNVWTKIANTLDQINSYNQAAKTLASGKSAASFLDYYNSLQGGN